MVRSRRAAFDIGHKVSRIIQMREDISFRLAKPSSAGHFVGVIRRYYDA
jgi:hypothetical protein